jgi:hypothetical protein
MVDEVVGDAAEMQGMRIAAGSCRADDDEVGVAGVGARQQGGTGIAVEDERLVIDGSIASWPAPLVVEATCGVGVELLVSGRRHLGERRLPGVGDRERRAGGARQRHRPADRKLTTGRAISAGEDVAHR